MVRSLRFFFFVDHGCDSPGFICCQAVILRLILFDAGRFPLYLKRHVKMLAMHPHCFQT